MGLSVPSRERLVIRGSHRLGSRPSVSRGCVCGEHPGNAEGATLSRRRADVLTVQCNNVPVGGRSAMPTGHYERFGALCTGFVGREANLLGAAPCSAALCCAHGIRGLETA